MSPHFVAEVWSEAGSVDFYAWATGALLGGYYGILSMCENSITKNNLQTLKVILTNEN